MNQYLLTTYKKIIQNPTFKTIISHSLKLILKFIYFNNLKHLNSSKETILVIYDNAADTTEILLGLKLIRKLSEKYNIIVLLLSGGELVNEFRQACSIIITPHFFLPSLFFRYKYICSLIINELAAQKDILFSIVNGTQSIKTLHGLADNFIPAIAIINERDIHSINEFIFWSSTVLFPEKISHSNYSDLKNKLLFIKDFQHLVENSSDFYIFINRVEELGLHHSMACKQQVKQQQIDFLTISKSGLFQPEFFYHTASENNALNKYLISWNHRKEWAKPKPFPGFHPGIYLQHHQTIENDPFSHFIENGKPDGPWQFEMITPKYHEPSTKITRRIALHLHIYYPDMANDLFQRLRKNMTAPDLFISTPSTAAKNKIEKTFASYQGNIIDIQIVPNAGRDIGPLLTAFAKKIINQYDILGHIHTKKSPHSYSAFTENWALFLLENLIGGKHPMMDTLLLKMQSDESIGLVFPEDPHVIGWDGNTVYAIEIARKLGFILDCDKEPYFNFPVGNMYWARTAAIKSLLELNLGWDDYPKEPVPINDTILHALERIMPFVVRESGFRNVVTYVPGICR